MLRQHTGRTGSTVLHPDFTTAPAAIAAAGHTALCEIRRPGGTPGTLNTTTGKKTTTPYAPHYAGPCAVSRQPASAGTDPVAGDEAVPTMEYVVTLAKDAAPQLHTGDLVVITSVGLHGDATLVANPYVVLFIDRDSVTAERVLRCSENQS
jgi:hypothetical protein